MKMPEKTIAYAIGDVHGCSWLLDKVLQWVLSHAENHGDKRRIVVVLGDFVDRGPDSKGTIDRLINGLPDGFELVCLRGNHEQMMMDCIARGTGLDLWLANGADMTLESYGVDTHSVSQDNESEAVCRILTQAIPEAHRMFLGETQHSLRLGDYVFVHAGIRPGIPLENQKPDDLLWIRAAFTESDTDHGFHVIHGHTVTDRPDGRKNRTGLDTGAVTTGRLSCLALWEDEREIFTTPGFG